MFGFGKKKEIVEQPVVVSTPKPSDIRIYCCLRHIHYAIIDEINRNAKKPVYIQETNTPSYKCPYCDALGIYEVIPSSGISSLTLKQQSEG